MKSEGMNTILPVAATVFIWLWIFFLILVGGGAA